MMHGYYTNKFIIIIVCYGQMQVHNPNNALHIRLNACISSVQKSSTYVFSNYIHHILYVPPFRPLAIHSTFRIKLPLRIMS